MAKKTKSALNCTPPRWKSSSPSALWYNLAMAKKTTLKEVGEMLTHVVKHMATKDDVKKLGGDVKRLDGSMKKLDDRLAGVESKVSGIDRRLDTEAMRRDDEKIPTRVASIEKKVFGASRAPAQH